MTTPSPNNAHPARQEKRKGHSLPMVLGTIALVIAGIGIFMRFQEGMALNKSTKENAIPAVAIMKAPQGPVEEEIILPGNVQAWHEAPIYARTNGYLKDWATDIGAPVKAGDLIAEIETPEVDAQLHQAEADLGTAQANNDLAQTTAERWKVLLKTRAVSAQDAADKIGAAAAAAAALASAQANLDRLKELESFKRIVAPFDGVITARNTDTGALINAGSSGNGPELFHIAETDKLRVYVQIPETYVPDVKADMTAGLHFAEHPGESFSAKLVHSADALDPVTRTLLIQLEVDNEKGELLPGGYAEVHIKLPSVSETVHLPVNTLLFRAHGMEVATIDDEGRALLKPIVIGRDYGKEVEVVSGIAPDEIVILNPPDSLATGQKVRIVTPADKNKENEKNNDGDKTKEKNGPSGSDEKQ